MTRYFYYSNFFAKKKAISQNNFQLYSNKPFQKIKKVQIQVSFKDIFFNIDKYIPYIVYLIEFFSNQKSTYGFSKSDVSFWRLRKKDIVSLFVTLRQEPIYNFIEKFVIFYSPKVLLNDNTIKVICNKNYVSFNITNFQFFNEVNTEIFKIQESKLKLSKLNIKVIVIFSSIKKKSKLNYLRDFQIPFYF